MLSCLISSLSTCGITRMAQRSPVGEPAVAGAAPSDLDAPASETPGDDLDDEWDRALLDVMEELELAMA